MENEVIHDPDNREFYCVITGLKSALCYYENPGFIDIYHTFVPAELRNRGIAQGLMEKAVEFARVSGRKILPTCSYAENYLSRHDELKDIIYNGQNKDQ
ncbi:MAG: GNAT family N-acetyltransferase [Brevinematales bacterium]|jgi:predicted GNAT family acetyltransferase